MPTLQHCRECRRALSGRRLMCSACTAEAARRVAEACIINHDEEFAKRLLKRDREQAWAGETFGPRQWTMLDVD